MTAFIGRREFIMLLGGAALSWPLAARAQQQAAIPRFVGLLLSQSEGSQEARDRVAAVREGLEKLGWIEGHNLRFETRYANGSADRLGEEAAELVQLWPDVLIASATAALASLKKATSTIPIVFAQVTDPVGAGFVRSSGATRGKRHRIYAARVFDRHQMAGAAKRTCAANRARRTHL